MLKYQFQLSLVVLTLLVTSIGCGKQKPSDLPPLFPCKITVMQGGQPLPGASVTLFADGHQVRFTLGAVTDKNGVATIKTNIDWEGAPEGKYKVCIKKIVVPSSSGSNDDPSGQVGTEEYNKKLAEASAQVKSLVDSKFLRPRNTPASITVTSSGIDETVDVGAAVDEFWNDVSRTSG